MLKAILTGCTGQDGSHLAEFLLSKGYEVHGIIRRSSTFTTGRINHIFDKIKLHYGDLSSAESIRKIIYNTNPDEFYNLGAMSHVKVSFDIPEYTMDIDGTGVIRILESIRDFKENTKKSIKFYQASSSELFGNQSPPQNEKTPFHPRSPYACAKAAGYYITQNYREAYGIFACNGILYNHEGERRGETFVTRKITRAATRIKVGLQDKLILGNLNAKRDWGYAADYVEAMWMMLQQEKPDDFIIATGESHSILEFIEHTFDYLELDWKKYVISDPKYFRPSEVDYLQGDATKARTILGWKPRTNFIQLIKIMVDSDLKLAKQELLSNQV